MPRKKRNALPKEELKFVESPKFIYHKSNVPIIQLSVNPVTLDPVPADEVSKNWVKPCFRTSNNCTTPLNARWPVRKPQRGRQKSKVKTVPPPEARDARVESSPEVVRKLNMQKYKPIIFKGLNDVESDVEDLSELVEKDGADADADDDGDWGVMEKTQTNSLISDNCSDVLGSGNDQIPCHVEPVVLDLTSQDASVSSSEEDAISNITFETPQAENSSLRDNSSASTPYGDVGRSPSSRLSSQTDSSVSSTQDSTGESISYSPTSPSLLQERNKSSKSKSGSFGRCQKRYELPTVLTSPHRSSPSEQLTQSTLPDPPTASSGLSPSFTRNPLPVLVSSFSNTDCSARSTERFRSEFFDCSDLVAAKKKAQRSEDVTSIVPDSCLTSEARRKRSSATKRCKTPKMPQVSLRASQVESIPGNDNYDHHHRSVVDRCFADDTPESQQGLTCRMKQVKNCPKILSLLAKATRKIPVEGNPS